MGREGTADNTIVDEEKHEAATPDVSGQITSPKNKGAELLYIVATPAPAGNALKVVANLS